MSDTESTEPTVLVFESTPEESFARQIVKSFTVNAAATAGTLMGLGAMVVVADKLRERRNKKAGEPETQSDTQTPD